MNSVAYRIKCRHRRFIYKLHEVMDVDLRLVWNNKQFIEHHQKILRASIGSVTVRSISWESALF